ncbi:MAG: hypothetical protein JWM44_1339 [Bacilli bacterium]|nr:hypothetical protein [Bacilli bacterium]
MSREQSPDRQRALKIWIKSKREKKPADIAAELGINAALVRKWKSIDRWDDLPEPRRGAPRGSKNAKGNKGGKGGPLGNDKAVKHGAFRKFLPQDPEYLKILDMVQHMDALDMIYAGIENSFVAFIRMEKIMLVTDKDEMIKELKKQKFEVHSKGRGMKKELIPVVVEEEWNFHFSYERYEKYAKTQATIYASLRAGIRQFLNAAPEDDERRARIAMIEAQTERVRQQIELAKDDGKKTEAEDWVSALSDAAERRKAKGKET